MGKMNEKVLFWASFFTLIAAGMGFAIRGDIMKHWGQDFGFTQTELGEITGMGLMGFGLTIIGFSFFADVWGYGRLMVIAFLLHAAAVFVTLAAPFAFSSYGKMGAYWCLYIGQFCFSLGNGTCEAVINPLTATLFPKNRTHWLNILHAGWPGGLVLGALVTLVLNRIPGGVGWMWRWLIVFAPMLLYGVMMLGRRFPTSEAKEQGVKLPEMMGTVGQLGAAVAAFFIGLWFSKDLFPGLFGLPGWLGWVGALVLWLGFGWVTQFSLGHWLVAFLLVIHAMVGYVELGTDNWIQNITNAVIANPDTAQVAFAWTNILMFTLRFFAGPIVHKISPVGLLFSGAVLGTAGLVLLGMPLINTTWLWLGAVTVYGIGKTFYWPTMLGVMSERFPRGGALALGFSGGVGMLSAGILGGPLIGYKQDYAATRELKQNAVATYDRYKSDTPLSPLPFLPPIAGLDNSKVGTLMNEGKELREDLAKEPNNKNLQERESWWKGAEPYATVDKPLLEKAQLDGGKQALTWTAAVPAAMAFCYLLLIIYFRAQGGYQAEVLTGHAAQDEEFTGGTEGPGEG
jgi:MFS family permease